MIQFSSLTFVLLGLALQFSNATNGNDSTNGTFPTRFRPTGLIQEFCDLWPWVTTPEGKVIEIAIVFFADRFRMISDIDESFELSGALSVVTKIPCLVDLYHQPQWPKERTNLTKEKQSDFWSPDIIHRNSISNIGIYGADGSYEHLAFFLESHAPTMRGTIWRIHYGNLFSFCNLNFFTFPFDEQFCQIDIFSVHGIHVTNITGAVLQIMEDNFMPDNSNWILVISKSEIYHETVGSTSFFHDLFSGAKFHFHFRRQANYFILNLYLPSQILGILLMSCFLLPPDSTDRAAVSCTVMLAVFVLQGQILANLPVTPKSIVAAYYATGQTFFGLVITVYSSAMCFLINEKYDFASRHILFCGKKMVFFYKIVDYFMFFFMFVAYTICNILCAYFVKAF